MELTGMTTLIMVYDMKESVKFYRDLLGFYVAETSGEEDYYWAKLTKDGMSLMLNTAYDGDSRPRTRDTQKIRVHNDTIFYFSCKDVRDCYRYFKSKSWPVAEPVSTHYGMEQVYTNDPDGYEICFQHPVKTNSVFNF